jgi:hypothetical protein
MGERESTLGRGPSLSCEREQRSEGVCLNLQGLTFAESRAIELLRGLRREEIPLCLNMSLCFAGYCRPQSMCSVLC